MQTNVGQLGSISEWFWQPLLPKVVILGFKANENSDVKDMIANSFENVLNVDFAEQFVVSSQRTSKSGALHSHFPNDSWFDGVRQHRASVVIDFIDLNDLDSASSQILQSKNGLAGSSSYLILISSNADIPSHQKLAIAKNFQMAPTHVFTLNTSLPKSEFLDNLKPVAQACFDASRSFYRQLGDKYKGRMSASTASFKFMQPWMQTIYYSFKMAFIEELKGEFEASLKYHHSILAKYKQMIEDSKANRELMLQIINYLRPSSEISFLKISFLLFRLDQTIEAEFGLFRFLSYFSQGLSKVDELSWRSNIARLYAVLLERSFFWNSKNRSIARGPAHFLLYSILNSLSVLKNSSDFDPLSMHDQVISDIISAIQSCSENLVYMNVYLQLELIRQYGCFGADEASRPFIDYLKNESLVKDWKNLIRSVYQYDAGTLSDTWSLACLDDKFADFQSFCQAALNVFECTSKPEFLNFLIIPNKLLWCAVKIHKKGLRIGEENVAELAIFNNSPHEFAIESVGLFFTEETFDAVVFDLDGPLDIQPFSMINLQSTFCPSKACGSPIAVAFVTMQLKEPYISIQYAAQNLMCANNIATVHWDSCVTSDGFRFMSFASSILKRHLQFTVNKIAPSLRIEFEMEANCYRAVPVPVQIHIFNASEQPITGELNFKSESFAVIMDRDGRLLLQPLQFKLDGNSQSVIPLLLKVFDCAKIVAEAKVQFDFDFMDMQLAEVYDSLPLVLLSNLHLDALNPFDLKMHKERLEQSITSKGVISKFKLLFSFQNTAKDFRVTSTDVLVNDFRIECRKVDATNNIFVAEINVTNDSVCKFEAVFELNSKYAPLRHFWPLPQVFKPEGLFVYSNVEDPLENLKCNSPCRVSWKIFNHTAQRLELLASPVCGPNVTFQGTNQKHLILNPETSEIMKGFIFVTYNSGSIKIPKLLLKDHHLGHEIAYLTNAAPEFTMDD